MMEFPGLISEDTRRTSTADIANLSSEPFRVLRLLKRIGKHEMVLARFVLCVFVLGLSEATFLIRY